MKTCKYCGAKLKNNYDFCCYCGEPCEEEPQMQKRPGVAGPFLLALVLFFLVTGVYLNREMIADRLLPLFYSGNALTTDSADPVFRYRGSRLSGKEYELYRKIAAAVGNHAASVPFTAESVDRVLDLAGYVYYDFPEFFWFKGSCSASYHYSFGGYSGTLNLEYTRTAEEIPAGKAELENATAWILQELQGRTEYEKIRGVYEYVINSTVYDASVTDQSCYSVLVERRGVCAGYSNAVCYLLERLGLDCIYVSGYSEGELHAWNMIRGAGDWYQLDATWGDPELADGRQVIRYDYMMLNDEEMLTDHSYTGDCTYPVCTAVAFNFFRAEGLFLQQYDYQALLSIFTHCRDSGRTLMFRCADDAVFQEAEYQLFSNEVIWSLVRDLGYRCENITYSSDPLHRTFYIDLA